MTINFLSAKLHVFRDEDDIKVVHTFIKPSPAFELAMGRGESFKYIWTHNFNWALPSSSAAPVYKSINL